MNNRKVNWGIIVNQGINLIYTIIFFTPVILFWAEYYALLPLIIIGSISVCFFFLPAGFFRLFQLSNSSSFYKRITIHRFQQITQQGKYAQLLIKSLSGERNNLFNKKKPGGMINQIRAFEVYHWACFAFFLATFFYALTKEAFGYAIIVFICNIFYNVIPILIQQYNTVRLNTLNQINQNRKNGNPI